MTEHLNANELPSREEQIKFKYLQLPKELDYLRPYAQEILTDQDLEELEKESFPLPQDFKEFLKYYAGISLIWKYEDNTFVLIKNQSNPDAKSTDISSIHSYKDKKRIERKGKPSKIYYWYHPELENEPIPERLYFAGAFGSGVQFFITREGKIYFGDIYHEVFIGDILIADNFNNFLKLIRNRFDFPAFYLSEYPESSDWINLIMEQNEKLARGEEIEDE